MAILAILLIITALAAVAVMFDSGLCMIGLISFPVLVLAILVIPLSHLNINAKMAKMEARESLHRSMERDITSAAWQMKVTEYNEQVAIWQFYNNGWLYDIWIPDAVDDMRPLK